MDAKEFKKYFDDSVLKIGFSKAFGGWIKKSEESILVLDLQKSNFGNYYELNIKIYIQGVFGKKYTISKDLIKRETGNIFRRQPPIYNNVFDLDNELLKDRKELIDIFIKDFLLPFSEKALTTDGIKQLAKEDMVYLLPAVEAELQ